MKTVKYRDETLSSELEAWAFVMTSWVSLGKSLDNAEPQFHSSPKFYDSTISSFIYFFYAQHSYFFHSAGTGMLPDPSLWQLSFALFDENRTAVPLWENS